MAFDNGEFNTNACENRTGGVKPVRVGHTDDAGSSTGPGVPLRPEKGAPFAGQLGQLPPLWADWGVGVSGDFGHHPWSVFLGADFT